MNGLLGLVLIFALSAAVAALTVKIVFMKRSAREISEKLLDILNSDTNTLIDISSADGDMRALASDLNTELRRLREERRLCSIGDAELKDAVTNVSHDLRTPLTAVCGYLELLRREETSASVRQYLQQIENRTEVIKQLTEELFRYSVVVAAKEMTLERLCVNDVLEESLASFYGAVTERGMIPEIDISEEKTERVLDRSALMRIFGNIISNALKYSDGDLAVSMDSEGVIVFRNSASNLEKISVERLFDRFYTVETGSRSTGLGLSIAKLLTEQMGGKILAEISGGALVISLKF